MVSLVGNPKKLEHIATYGLHGMGFFCLAYDYMPWLVEKIEGNTFCSASLINHFQTGLTKALADIKYASYISPIYYRVKKKRRISTT